MSERGFFAVRELQPPCALWGCHGFGYLLCRHWKQGEHQKASAARSDFSFHRHVCAETSHTEIRFLTHTQLASWTRTLLQIPELSWAQRFFSCLCRTDKVEECFIHDCHILGILSSKLFLEFSYCQLATEL